MLVLIHHGQLGNGDFQDKTQLQHISFFDTINITKIASGTYHSLFLSKDGNAYSFGANSSGQLGIGTRTTESPYGLSSVQTIGSGINYVFAAQYHSFYIS